ncbi:MAG: DUF4340 domain-containing protein [Bacteroidales bacterium]|nr:DUF4340 domain-containing protein [Bacteroidales bacterium]
MKKNRVIILAIVVLVIVAIFSILNYSTGTYQEKIKKFAVDDTSRVTKIFLADKSDLTVLLERSLDGGWTVNQKYEASTPMMQLFLETICRIRVKNPVPQKSTDFIFKRMSANSTKIEIYERCYRIDFWGIQWFPHEKMTRCYYVGDPTQDNMGTFMLMDGADIPFVVYLPGFRGFVSTRYNVSEQDWRSHVLLNLNAPDIKSITMDYQQEPYHSFSIDVDENSISFHSLDPQFQPAAVDTLKLFNFLNSFKNINFETILNAEMDSLIFDSIVRSEPMQLLSIETKTGQSMHYRLFPMITMYGDKQDGKPVPNKDRFYILTEEGDLLLAQYFVFDKILRKRDFFCR